MIWQQVCTDVRRCECVCVCVCILVLILCKWSEVLS